MTYAVTTKTGTFFAGFSGNDVLWTADKKRAVRMTLQSAKIQAALFLSSACNIEGVQRKPVAI